MKASNYIKHILPSIPVCIGLLIVPLLLTTYFVVTQFSDQFIAENSADFYSVQNEWLNPIFINSDWINWVNRFMDFAFWGMLALIVMVIGWSISSAKVAFKNHYAIEEFANFRESRISWHSQFYVVSFLKIATLIIMVYAIIAVLALQAPQLSLDVSIMLKKFSTQALKDVVLTASTLYLYSLLAVAAFKTFRYLRAD